MLFQNNRSEILRWVAGQVPRGREAERENKAILVKSNGQGSLDHSKVLIVFVNTLAGYGHPGIDRSVMQ